MYDVVIVGAGPAGLMAARSLPDSFSFIVIDSKEKIGVPLRCGEGVRENEFLSFFGNKDYSFVKNTVHSHEIIYGDLKREVKVNFLELDREGFENFLSDPVKDRLKLNTNCKDIRVAPEYAEVITNKGNFKTKLVILANGSNYQLQKKLGLVKKDQELIVGYGGIYHVKDIDEKKFYYYFEHDYKGYLWIFPKGKGYANIGYGSFDDKNPKKTLDLLLKKYDFDFRKVSEYGGIVSVSGPIDKTYAERILTCGGGAGFVYAGTGEGIQFALQSGKIVSEVAKDAVDQNDFSSAFLKRYEKKWKKSIGPSMKAGIIFRDIFHFALRKNIVKKIFKIPSEKELKMFVLEGQIPIRARILWYLTKLF